MVIKIITKVMVIKINLIMDLITITDTIKTQIKEIIISLKQITKIKDIITKI